MDQAKAYQIANLVSERTFISDMMKEFMVALRESGDDTKAITNVRIYARWIPDLVEKAAEEMGEIDRKIREL